MMAPRPQGGKELRGRRPRLLGIVAACALAAAGLATASAGTASAQTNSIAGILGQAGPNSTAGPLAVIALTGLTCSSVTVNGNVAVAAGTFNSTYPNCVWNGTTYRSSGVTLAGNTFTATPPHLEPNVEDALMTQIRDDALAAQTTFRDLPPTPGMPANITSTTGTITGTRGLNVLNVGTVNPGNQTVTLTGPPGTQFVINVSHDYTNTNGHIVLAGGVTESDVVFNILPGASVTLSNAGTDNNGIILDPTGSFQDNHAPLNGILIGATVTLTSGAIVTAGPKQIPTPTVGILLQSGTSQSFTNTVSVGEPAHAAVWVVGGDPVGTVEFRYYDSGTACTAAVAAFNAGGAPSGGTQVGTPVAVPESLHVVSAAQTFSTPGTYYWAAFYSGNTTVNPSVSSCAPLTVT